MLDVYTDAALGNLNDGKDSTGGHLIFLSNPCLEKVVCLDWQANKIKKIVRSTLAAEALSLCEGLESGIYHRELIEEICSLKKGSINIRAFVDNQSTIDAVRSTTNVNDKRLRRDIAALKEMIDTKEVNSLTWVPGHCQLADVLTKNGVKGEKPLSVIQNASY